MSSRWVVDAEHPAGRIVEMTAAEQHQRDADEEAGAAAAAAALAAASYEAERRSALDEAREAFDQGAIFATLSDDDRAVIGLLLEAAT